MLPEVAIRVEAVEPPAWVSSYEMPVVCEEVGVSLGVGDGSLLLVGTGVYVGVGMSVGLDVGVGV